MRVEWNKIRSFAHEINIGNFNFIPRKKIKKGRS
jgi:hypothetical protein